MKKESGFSFIEVMIAILLLSIIIAGSSVIPSAVRNLRSRIETTTAATNIAAGMIEDYRNRVFETLKAETKSFTMTNGPSPLLYPVTYNVSVVVSGFDVDANGALTAQASNPQVKKVIVLVTWVAGGQNGQTQMSALMVNNGQGAS